MTFQELQVMEPILKALQTEGYTHPTPIQTAAIPTLLTRKDMLGCAQTGTGKTAAFAIPIIQLMTEDNAVNKSQYRKIRALILTPTRELAIQIGESFEAYGRHTSLRTKVIFGGVNQFGQVQAIRSGIDVLVATPGRLLDLIQQKIFTLSDVQYFVLDEADRMLDMGFVHDVKKVIAMLPRSRQSLFFSATMPPAIVDLANTILTNPTKVEVTPASSTVEIIEQHLYHVDKNNKRHLLLDVLKTDSVERALVFTRTKHGADRVVKDLIKAGVPAQAIHGNKSQNARQLALSNFKSKTIRVLVATDIAARGIDIDELSHVINFELPNIPESYVHRIGRTGRAGAGGVAISFCDAEEKAYVKDIQKLIGKSIPLVENHSYPLMQHHVSSTPSIKQPRNHPRESHRSGGNNFRNAGQNRNKRQSSNSDFQQAQ